MSPAEPLNVAMALLLIVLAAVGVLIANSPDALQAMARRMRARSQALHASREAYESAYHQSMADDARLDKERREARRMFQELCAPDPAEGKIAS